VVNRPVYLSDIPIVILCWRHNNVHDSNNNSNNNIILYTRVCECNCIFVPMYNNGDVGALVKGKRQKGRRAQIASGRNNMAVNTDCASVCTVYGRTLENVLLRRRRAWHVYTLRAPRRRFNSILISCFVAYNMRYARDGGRVTRASNKHCLARHSVQCAPDDGCARYYDLLRLS